MQDLPFIAAVKASLAATARATLRTFRLAVTDLTALEAGLVASTSTSPWLEGLRAVCLAVTSR